MPDFTKLRGNTLRGNTTPQAGTILQPPRLWDLTQIMRVPLGLDDDSMKAILDMKNAFVVGSRVVGLKDSLLTDK